MLLYKDEYGFVHLTGDLENYGEELLENLRVYVDFYDENDEVVANSWITIDSLQPYAIASFELLINNLDVSGRIVSWEARVERDV